MKSVLPIILALGWTSQLIASPTSDLSSPLQETRDAAAKILRTSFIPPARTNWSALVARIKVGDLMANVLKLIRQYSPKMEESGMSASSGRTGFVEYRLDDLWVLRCDFEYISDNLVKTKLIGQEIVERMRDVWVAPPTKFTGIWITYFVNGQKSREIQYQDGNCSGELTAYNPDGSKNWIQHYDRPIGEYEETGYFPSGRIRYQGQYKTNRESGIWINYNEDGSTNSVKDYSKP